MEPQDISEIKAQSVEHNGLLIEERLSPAFAGTFSRSPEHPGFTNFPPFSSEAHPYRGDYIQELKRVQSLGYERFPNPSELCEVLYFQGNLRRFTEALLSYDSRINRVLRGQIKGADAQEIIDYLKDQAQTIEGICQREIGKSIEEISEFGEISAVWNALPELLQQSLGKTTDPGVLHQTSYLGILSDFWRHPWAEFTNYAIEHQKDSVILSEIVNSSKPSGEDWKRLERNGIFGTKYNKKVFTKKERIKSKNEHLWSGDSPELEAVLRELWGSKINEWYIDLSNQTGIRLHLPPEGTAGILCFAGFPLKQRFGIVLGVFPKPTSYPYSWKEGYEIGRGVRRCSTNL